MGATVTFDLDGGYGRDLVLATTCAACEETAVDLGGGTWSDERQDATVTGFENAGILGDGLVLHGSADANHLWGFGCGARVYGLGGDDSLARYEVTEGCAPARLRGGDGNDTLIGGDTRDLLYGGRGYDQAYAGLGFDLCHAEEEDSCEE